MRTAVNENPGDLSRWREAIRRSWRIKGRLLGELGADLFD
jgi:hypothetical protein